MSHEYSEDNLIESATQQVLEELGWQVSYAWKQETYGQNGLLGRENKSEVILNRYLLAALKELNPGLPAKVYEDAVDKINERNADKTFGRTNKEKYELLKNGIPVSYTNANGEIEKPKLRVFNFDEPTQLFTE